MEVQIFPRPLCWSELGGADQMSQKPTLARVKSPGRNGGNMNNYVLFQSMRGGKTFAEMRLKIMANVPKPDSHKLHTDLLLEAPGSTF